MSRRVFLQSLTALLGGLALPALTQAKPVAPGPKAGRGLKRIDTVPEFRAAVERYAK